MRLTSYLAINVPWPKRETIYPTASVPPTLQRLRGERSNIRYYYMTSFISSQTACVTPVLSPKERSLGEQNWYHQPGSYTGSPIPEKWRHLCICTALSTQSYDKSCSTQPIQPIYFEAMNGWTDTKPFILTTVFSSFQHLAHTAITYVF